MWRVLLGKTVKFGVDNHHHKLALSPMPSTRPTVPVVPSDLSHAALKQRHRQVRDAPPLKADHES